MQQTILPGVRHRGVFHLSGGQWSDMDDPTFVAVVLRNLGFGDYVRVWDNSQALPLDWPSQLVLDPSWPWEELWFEADWHHTTSPTPPLILEGNDLHRLGGRAWDVPIVGPYCFSWQGHGAFKAANFPWCPGMEPPPPPQVEPPPPEVVPPGGQPPVYVPPQAPPTVGGGGKSDNASTLKGLLVAIAVGGIVGTAGMAAYRYYR